MPHTIVIFGASGDLTSRKLIPALYLLFQKGRLPKPTRIIGVSRTAYSHDAWRSELAASTQKYLGSAFVPAVWDEFAAGVFYQPGNIDKPDDFAALSRTLEELEQGTPASRLYYLSTAPSLYKTAIQQLGAAGLASEERGVRRIVIEKPFGVDLPSARGLNQATHDVFSEQQVYSIYHYLGKERYRTFSCCGLPTRSSSRSGTAITSTTCRSPWPRRWTSAAAAAITTPAACSATCSRTISSSS
jgi:glucose-6-phosphate 1-dehydrogenase